MIAVLGFVMIVCGLLARTVSAEIVVPRQLDDGAGAHSGGGVQWSAINIPMVPISATAIDAKNDNHAVLPEIIRYIRA
jgi:hypothetical protein